MFEYLEVNQPLFLKRLAAYIHFPSVSTQSEHRGDLLACADWLWRHCQSVGLTSEIIQTGGNPVVLATTRQEGGHFKPHFLVYGHYDVQPVEPLSLWHSPPFDLTRDGDRLIGRGASDNKGQHFAHLNVIEAFLKTGTELPCDVTFVIEGEEEIGSPSFAGFLSRESSRLCCDGIVISDTTIPGLRQPGVACSLRGLVSASIKISGPAQDVHSGLHGGAIENPAQVLCSLLAGCRNAAGTILVPGFYDSIIPVDARERESLLKLPFDEAAYCRSLGVSRLAGEEEWSALERTTVRPTFEIHGLKSGYQGEGIKTIIPAVAEAKVSLRLVAGQKPEEVLTALEQMLRAQCPDSVKLEFIPGFRASPYAISQDHPLVQAGLNALRLAFEAEPLLLREGVTIPVLQLLRETLGTEVLLLGLALPDDGMHSPNEKLSLAAFNAGMRMSAHLWQELTATVS